METYAQSSINHCIDMLAPFESSAPELKEGQWQFYMLMTSIYQGMYENPEGYFVFPKPYEEYRNRLQQKTAYGTKEKEHVTDSKESTLRNTFQQAIQFYAMFFYNLGMKASAVDEETGALILSKEEYSNVLAQMNRLHGSVYNSERYKLLSETGIVTYEDKDSVYVIHGQYKQAMKGLWFLCKAPDSKYKWMNFLRLDYKNAYSPIPTVDDICKTIPDKNAEVIRKLEEHLQGMKIKKKIKPLRGIVSDFKWKVEYSCKGKNICGFYADNSYFMLCIYFNHFNNINEFARELYEEDVAMFQWFKKQFPERLCKCPNNRRVYFGEEARRICGLSNRAEIVNPEIEDVEKAWYVLNRILMKR
ncbi:MAG: hypothetical protein IKU39_08750 [Lachnospiraceae bacterium]|nr:hypothetical protein [Lachnospiraceae bacterium]